MPEYIDREAAKSALLDRRMFTCMCTSSHDVRDMIIPSEAFKRLNDVPISDVAPVRHGKWIRTKYTSHPDAKDECNLCGFHLDGRWDLTEYLFCPVCGAKMENGEALDYRWRKL